MVDAAGPVIPGSPGWVTWCAARPRIHAGLPSNVVGVSRGVAVVVAVRVWRAAGGRRGYQALRETFGGVLLLGLEILVAADLIRTLAITPTLQSVIVLGVIELHGETNRESFGRNRGRTCERRTLFSRATTSAGPMGGWLVQPSSC